MVLIDLLKFCLMCEYQLICVKTGAKWANFSLNSYDFLACRVFFFFNNKFVKIEKFASQLSVTPKILGTKTETKEQN